MKLELPTEAWIACAWGVLVLAVLFVAFLALRLPGPWPVRVFTYGPLALPALALVVAFFGSVFSLRRRPFVTSARMRAFAVLALVIVGTSYPFPFPARREGHPSAIELFLPVRGEWTVVWGAEPGNLRARTRADRRFGLDLVMTREGKSHADEGLELASYYGYGQPVYAPTSGTVARVVDAFADRVPGTPPESGRPEFGNLIVIEIAPEEFFFLGGLQQGSIRVKEGAQVTRGQELARVGHSTASRFTLEPHLLVHLQDTAVPHLGQSVPWFLTGYRSNGRTVLRGMPSGGPRYSGELVEALEQPE